MKTLCLQKWYILRPPRSFWVALISASCRRSWFMLVDYGCAFVLLEDRWELTSGAWRSLGWRRIDCEVLCGRTFSSLGNISTRHELHHFQDYLSHGFLFWNKKSDVSWSYWSNLFANVVRWNMKYEIWVLTHTVISYRFDLPDFRVHGKRWPM